MRYIPECQSRIPALAVAVPGRWALSEAVSVPDYRRVQVVPSPIPSHAAPVLSRLVLSRLTARVPSAPGCGRAVRRFLPAPPAAACLLMISVGRVGR